MDSKIYLELIAQTQDLKAEYIAKTKVWAKNYYHLMQARAKWKEVDWCKYFGLTPQLLGIANDGKYLYGFPTDFYNTSNARIYNSMKSEIRRILSVSLNEYVQKEVQRAEYHYMDSIEKLVYRLLKKGYVNGMDFTVKHGKVGVNFECIIKFADKTVRAWTIIASGPVQRPHYRYLIK